MKKRKYLFVIVLLLSIFYIGKVSAGSTAASGDLCAEDGVKRAFLILGTIKDVIKIMIPAVLIIIGSITIFKTVTYGDDSEIKNAMMDLGKKVIISLLIFFVPEIIEAMVSLVGSKYDSVKSGFTVCWDCFAGNSCYIKGVNEGKS